ncbi:MAG TPA: hypothetical protein VGP65_09150 [Candidatus Angelobacter sp.]|jgi:hypothetical protein|nr:hypothetical protein [Candidatus Angelobacter sp.]
MSTNHKLTMTPHAHSGSGDVPMLQGRVFLYEVGGMPGDERVQIVNSAGSKKSSWQIHYVATRQKTGDYKTKEEALAALAAAQPKTLEEIKKAALALGYTKIQCETVISPAVYLRYWTGFSSHVKGGMYATVDYYLEGNKPDRHKVRVHKTLKDEDHRYILS